MGYWGRLRRKPVTYAHSERNVKDEEHREELMYEQYRKYPSELIDAFSKAMVDLHNEDVLTHVEFLFLYTYLMTKLNFQDLADRYVVGFDSTNPSYASRQYVHFGIIGKALKAVVERVARDHDIKELLQSADIEMTDSTTHKLAEIVDELTGQKNLTK